MTHKIFFVVVAVCLYMSIYLAEYSVSFYQSKEEEKLFSEKFSFVMSACDRWRQRGLKVEIGCI